jgi:ABC-type branched-subunit amino acid transport system permease subunit
MINPYWELIILLCLINIIFAVSLNLILGYNGQFSLGHAAFLAIGAYASGSLTANFGWPLWAGILMAIVFSIIGAVIIGYPCLRLRGDYLAIATLGFAEIVRIIANAPKLKVYFGGATGMQNIKSFYKYIPETGSVNGMGNLLFTALFALLGVGLLVWGVWAFANMMQRIISRFLPWPYWRWSLVGLALVLLLVFIKPVHIAFLDIFQFGNTLKTVSFGSQQWVLFLLFLLVVGIVTWLIRNYLNSVPGRAVVAIREDEIAATNLGVNCTWMKLQNFMYGSALAGLAGAMLAHTLPLFKPTDFNFFKSVDVLLMVVLGGMGSITGSFVGATIITILLEALRFLGQWRLVFYSLILILFMIFRPGGLLGAAEIGDLLKRKASGGLKRLLGEDDEPRTEGDDAGN